MMHVVGLILMSSANAMISNCSSGYVVQGNCVPDGLSPLDYYVNHLPSSDYHYEETPLQTLQLEGATAYVLNMTSQTWLNDGLFTKDSPSASVWVHQLVVIVPSNLSKKKSTGWLWVTGGDNSIGKKFTPIDPKSSDRDEVQFSAQIARQTGTVAVILKQVPNQPVKFVADPNASAYPHGRKEDGIIAYGWNHFIYKDNTAAEWLLRLPMTKAVTRAMDTAIDFVQKKEGLILHDFVVGGASKRGWTTWTAGLVESRCAAIVPVVMDLLNLLPNTMAQYQALGGFTFAYEDYVLAGSIPSGDAYAKMGRVNDPYEVRGQ
jgi:PhoPQ-activated pathogenicity-related protein